MSPGTFLLILAAVVVVFAAYVIRSWFDLSGTVRRKRGRKDRNR